MAIETTEIEGFVKDHICEFHNNRLHSLSRLKLNDILKRKNPYLFKAKNILTAQELVKTLLDAYLSSQEETIFGEFLEKLAIFSSSKVSGGYKSGIEGIDLELNKDQIRYIITVKSGPNWGNSSQINKMKDHFVKAKKILRTTNSLMHVVAINGCCYGKDNNPDKGEYLKYCGQRFWTFITEDESFYIKIIEPLGYEARKRNEEFDEEYAKIINQFTGQFIDLYCDQNGSIAWERLVVFNSGNF